VIEKSLPDQQRRTNFIDLKGNSTAQAANAWGVIDLDGGYEKHTDPVVSLHDTEKAANRAAKAVKNGRVVELKPRQWKVGDHPNPITDVLPKQTTTYRSPGITKTSFRF